ncbi:MAG TPA: PDZ domain-containing protein, partial [Candidatus Pacearchaeota archaeon]|nr:PDZ domain-containing protein [Candidatus Pacearchaeota archaeon]
MKLKFTFKIWILIIVLAFSLLAIFGMPPTFIKSGVLITSIDSNSTAFEQGLRQGQIITEIDGQKIISLEDFSNALQGKYDSNESVKTIIKTENSGVILFSDQPPEITVSEIPKTQINLGLDLSGGARALVQAKDKKLSSAEINDLVDITSNRLNEFGLTDLKVLPVSDLGGEHYMLIEIAGATPKALEEMISKQGKFEAKIGNDTVFIGGERDIASVCRGDATCSRVERPVQIEGGYASRFLFSITLSAEAAQR